MDYRQRRAFRAIKKGRYASATIACVAGVMLGSLALLSRKPSTGSLRAVSTLHEFASSSPYLPSEDACSQWVFGGGAESCCSSTEFPVLGGVDVVSLYFDPTVPRFGSESFVSYYPPLSNDDLAAMGTVDLKALTHKKLDLKKYDTHGTSHEARVIQALKDETSVIAGAANSGYPTSSYRFYFTSAINKEIFDVEPEKFLPAFDGFDAAEILGTQMFTKAGHKNKMEYNSVYVDLAYSMVQDDHLFLFNTAQEQSAILSQSWMLPMAYNNFEKAFNPNDNGHNHNDHNKHKDKNVKSDDSSNRMLNTRCVRSSAKAVVPAIAAPVDMYAPPVDPYALPVDAYAPPVEAYAPPAPVAAPAVPAAVPAYPAAAAPAVAAPPAIASPVTAAAAPPVPAFAAPGSAAPPPVGGSSSLGINSAPAPPLPSMSGATASPPSTVSSVFAAPATPAAAPAATPAAAPVSNPAYKTPKLDADGLFTEPLLKGLDPKNLPQKLNSHQKEALQQYGIDVDSVRNPDKLSFKLEQAANGVPLSTFAGINPLKGTTAGVKVSTVKTGAQVLAELATPVINKSLQGQGSKKGGAPPVSGVTSSFLSGVKPSSTTALGNKTPSSLAPAAQSTGVAAFKPGTPATTPSFPPPASSGGFPAPSVASSSAKPPASFSAGSIGSVPKASPPGGATSGFPAPKASTSSGFPAPTASTPSISSGTSTFPPPKASTTGFPAPKASTTGFPAPKASSSSKSATPVVPSTPDLSAFGTPASATPKTASTASSAPTTTASSAQGVVHQGAPATTRQTSHTGGIKQESLGLPDFDSNVISSLSFSSGKSGSSAPAPAAAAPASSMGGGALKPMGAMSSMTGTGGALSPASLKSAGSPSAESDSFWDKYFSQR